MFPFLKNIFENIFTLYKRRNLVWQLIFVVLTFVLVSTNFDWWYYQSTRGFVIQSFLFPAVILGFLIPVFLPIVLFFYSKFTKNTRMTNAVYASMQAGLLGLGISSFYKVFTGRMGPPHILTSFNTSQMFRFGILRGGAFQGWPSSHTSVAFAMSMAVFTLYPENKLLRIITVIYACYIGVGISVNIHWFSDFVAGMILGSIIGITVGKSFLKNYKNK